MWKDQVVAFFEDYARSFSPPVREGVAVNQLRRSPGGDGWEILTASGNTLSNGDPVWPNLQRVLWHTVELLVIVLVLSVLIGVVIVLVIVGVFTVIQRKSQYAALANETEKMSVPTVAVAHPTIEAPQEDLVLPGTLQGFVQSFGGALVGLSTAVMRQQLGPLMNGVVLLEQWVPAPPLRFPGVMEFLKIYRAKAPAEGVDPLGVFLPPFAYAEMQVLEQAITAVGSLDEDKLAQYMHSHPFKTIVGDISFGPDGEWTEARPIFVQYHGIKGNDLDQFRDDSRITLLSPPQFKTGELIWPYSKARE